MSEKQWWPTTDEYNPGISKEKWLQILNDRSITYESNLHILACFYNFGGEGTCSQLAEKYGNSSGFYNSSSTSFAKRIIDNKYCKKPDMNEENSQRWPVIFLGHEADKNIPGTYVWKLRDELKEACKEYNIEKWLNMALFDSEEYRKALKAYKKEFNLHINAEIYKWKAVKQFQDNWNIDAENFSKMLETSFSKTRNLLANNNNYPLGMLKDFCKVAPEELRTAFRKLYDENNDIIERIKAFIIDTDNIRNKYNPNGWKSTFQSTNAISTYLWLRYPEKYVIYKYSEIDMVSTVLNSLYEPESGSVESLEEGFNFYNLLSLELKKDNELIGLLKSKLTDDCYTDPECKTLAIDFGFFISRYYHKNWIVPCNPKDYDIDNAFKKFNIINWKQAKNYSVGDYVYIYVSSNQKHISYKTKITKINVPDSELINDEEFQFNNENYKDSKKMELELIGCSNSEGLNYSELKKQGLKSNLQSSIILTTPLLDYVDSFFEEDKIMNKKRLWKVSHGTADFSEEDINKCLNDSYVCVHKDTRAKGIASIPQGKAFTDEVNPGDLFYLCRANQRLLLIGEFSSDPVKIDDDGWAWRKYKKLYSPIKDGSYNGPSKWWTPNNNSTFIEIKQKEYSDFEELILKPFFGIDLQTLNLIGGDNNMEKIEEYKELLLENYNIILHGAPGTGKTHLAKEIAKSMGCTDNEIGFVQFHPSYDYTDFVEGLRPNDRGTFDRIDGIFKEFCSNAIESQKEYEKYQKGMNKNEVDVQDLFSQYCMYVEKKIMESDDKLFPFSNSMKIRRIARNKQGAPISIEIATSLETSTKQNLSSSIFYRDYLDYKNGTIKSFQDVRPTFESKTKFHGNADYYFKLYQLVETFEKSEEFDSKNPFFDSSEEKKPKNYVFIIDEINRGELSKIFGELFFSIDPGYRGVDENSKPKGVVKTQYQNLVDEDDVFSEGFYIPENVYIIGTMNDIDRSVESMDFAMRRRFIFEEVSAEDSAKNMNLSDEAKEIMKRINNVISKTAGLNEAYEIGGAYFLNVTDYNKLWKIKLSSLIKEYLRGIDDDGLKFKKIKEAYFNHQTEEPSENDDENTPTVG